MKYPVKAFIVYLIAMVILAVINETVNIELNTLHLSLCGLFMYGTTIAVHHFTVQASYERPQRFPTYFYGHYWIENAGLHYCIRCLRLHFQGFIHARHYYFFDSLCGLHRFRGNICTFFSKAERLTFTLFSCLFLGRLSIRKNRPKDLFIIV